MKNIVLAGLGLHARHHHYKALEKFSEEYKINLKLIIDLEDQKEHIEKYISDRKLKPEKILLLDAKYRICEEVPEEALRVLGEIHKTEGIDGMVISTEPKAHKAYILWAVRNNIDVIVDKPISAPVLDNREPNSAKEINEDYLEIEKALLRSKSNVILMAPRRVHPGYNFIRNYLKDFLAHFRVPITYINIYYSEGMWDMPDEFYYRENHPYKYGYGLMLHSGYHFVDMFLWFALLNQELKEHQADSLELSTKHVNVYDFLHQINEESYKKIFGIERFDRFFDETSLDLAKKLGDTDLHLLCQLKQGETVKTTGSLNLLQTSFSRRSWDELPQDTYKENGRVRHENINIQVGHFLNIQAYSYSAGKDAETGQKLDDFNVMIFRNSGLVGGKPFTQHTFEDNFENEGQKVSLLGTAREELLRKWLEGSREYSNFESHKETVHLLSKIHESMFRQNIGLSPEEKMEFDTLLTSSEQFKKIV